jgi:hypothetical protein
MMPNRSLFGFLEVIIANADNLHFKILHPVAVFYIIVVFGSVFRLERFENSQRIFHVVVKVSTDKVVESFDSVVEDFHIVNGSEKS